MQNIMFEHNHLKPAPSKKIKNLNKYIHDFNLFIKIYIIYEYWDP